MSLPQRPQLFPACGPHNRPQQQSLVSPMSKPNLVFEEVYDRSLCASIIQNQNHQEMELSGDVFTSHILWLGAQTLIGLQIYRIVKSKKGWLNAKMPNLRRDVHEYGYTWMRFRLPKHYFDIPIIYTLMFAQNRLYEFGSIPWQPSPPSPTPQKRNPCWHLSSS